MTLSAVMPVTRPTKRLRAELPARVGSSGSWACVAGKPGKFQPVHGEPAGVVLDRGQASVLRPAPDGVVTDTEKPGGLGNANFRHSLHNPPFAANIATLNRKSGNESPLGCHPRSGAAALA